MGSIRPEAGTSRWATAAEQFRRWLDGESSALDDLVRTLTPVLWQVVRAYGLDRHQAEDVVQTTWLTLVRKSSSIEDPQAVSSWLTTTARREAWRVSRTTGKLLPVEDEELAREAEISPGADSDVVAADERDRLWSSVGELSPRCQRLLRIIAFDDRPDYAGIARDLDMPIGSIGPTRGRCLAKLKDLLATNSGKEQ
ncbi:MAG: RNA polymerase sigma factor [Nocardioidaceae bacterium]